VAALHAEGRDVLIQPYIDSVDPLGERALVFVDGQYTHAMTKGALLNVPVAERDFRYRRAQMSLAEGEAGAIECASEVLSTIGFSDLRYARVDLVATIRGGSSWSSKWSSPRSFSHSTMRPLKHLRRGSCGVSVLHNRPAVRQSWMLGAARAEIRPRGPRPKLDGQSVAPRASVEQEDLGCPQSPGTRARRSLSIG
jgi:hypothetical protein